MFFKKKYKYVLIILLLIMIIIGPLLIHYVYEYRELSNLYRKMNYDIKKSIELSNNDYSEYFDVKTLTFKIKRIYISKLGNLGIDISYEVDSSYDDFWSATESLALHDMKKFVKKWADRNNYYFNYYDHSARINGVKSNENVVSLMTEYDNVLWEYNGETLKLRALPLYTSITIIIYVIVIIMILIGMFALWINKLQKENVKVSCFFDAISTISIYLLIYIVIGIFSGGLGFFLLPILCLIDRK